MASHPEHLSSAEATNYFTQPWTITTPSRPNVKFFLATPSHHDEWLPIIINPENNKLMDDVKDKIWDEAAISEWRTRVLDAYTKSLTACDHLNLLISENDKVLGYGNLFKLKDGSFNVGCVLDVSAQGKGIGKLSTAVMITLAFKIGKEDNVEAGTMKANAAMRGVMRSLGIEEKEKLVVVEGRGVLAELSYTIERSKWKDIGLDVNWEKDQI